MMSRQSGSSDSILILLAIEDITERKRLETELNYTVAQAQSARSAAESANHAKDDFLSMVSHELRNPLSAILGWAQLLRTQQLDEARIAHGLETIGDPDRLQQVIWNLLSNAIKFTPTAGRIEIDLKHLADLSKITVSDTGVGIEPAFLSYVFDRWSQAGISQPPSKHGLGLGLSIVRSLVELHGDTVSVASPGTGQGTTFTILLPLQKSIVGDSLPLE